MLLCPSQARGRKIALAGQQQDSRRRGLLNGCGLGAINMLSCSKGEMVMAKLQERFVVDEQ